MSLSRYYIENIIIGKNVLAGIEVRHLIAVMRGKVGDSLELFDGKGAFALAQITAMSKRRR